MAIKKILSGALVFVLGVASLTSCGKEANVAVSDEKITLTYWCNNYANAYIDSYQDTAYYQMIEEKNNVDLEFMHPIVGQQTEQFNVLIASGDYPDIVEYSWNNYSGGILKALSDGVIIPLDEYITENTMPNFKKLLDENEDYRKGATNYAGTIGLFPGFSEGIKINPYVGPTIRKDWLDKLGLEMPETIDDWYNVLKAFKEQDPNGNGQADEIPFTDDSSATLRFFAAAFGAGMEFIQVDGDVVYGPAMPEYKEFLRTMNQWYNEGLIDTEYAAQNRKNVDYKLTSDISGAYVGFTGSQMGNYIAAKKGSDFKLSAAPWPKKTADSPNYCGYELMTRLTTIDSGAAITKNNKYPERTAKMFDWMYSEEGTLAKNYGIEGETYIKTDNGYEYTEKITNSPDGKDPIAALVPYTFPNWGTAGSVTLIDAYDKIARSYDEQREAAEIWIQGDMSHLLPALIFSPEETDIKSEYESDLTTKVSEYTTKAIIGSVSIDTFDDYVAELKNIGLDKVIDAYQAAYDRYLQ